MGTRFRIPLLLVAVYVLASVLPAGALEITSVTPAQATPGSAVTVTGRDFGPQVRVLLGDRRIQPDGVGSRQLFFTVPQLPEGEYTLSLRSGETLAPQSFVLRVVAPAPRITSLAPRNIDICSSLDDRLITIRGENFHPGVSLLLDGKSVPFTREAEGVLTFTPPVLDAGVYGVQVINPDDKSSLPYSLYFNNVPEILSVTQGEDFVNAYQLIIEGKNFFFDSALVVTVSPGDFSGLPPAQKVIVGRTETSSGQEQLPGRTQSDIIRYVDCRTLIYKRFPYSAQEKEISLQVINPDGKASSIYTLTAP